MPSDTGTATVDPESDCALRVDGLTVRYGERSVLQGLDLQLGRGRSLSITGPSGSGKSTLLSCILGLHKAQAGRITIGGVDVIPHSRGAAEVRRTRLGMIFQSGELLTELTAVENVLMAALLGGQAPRQAETSATQLLRQLGVPLRNDTIATYSGGEQQRVAVARALVNRPELVLADEPTASLDHETRDQVIGLLHNLPSEFGCSLVIATHDTDVAAACDDHARLVDGRLIGQHS